MAEQQQKKKVVLIDTVIVKATGTYADGEKLNKVYRVPKHLWKKELKDVAGLAAWLRERDPRLTDDLQLAVVREEETPEDQLKVKPEL